MTIEVSRAQARRFLVARHGLAPPRSLPDRPESVLTVVERLAVLQFDPLEVPGARNHDLVLHARIAGYRRAWADQWLYGPDRRLFEIYNKSLNIVPIGELPHYRLAWARAANHYENRILREHAGVADEILATIRSDGPQSTAAFAHHSHAIDWWWAPTRAARAVLEALFVSGRVGISRRDGNRRYYDLIERLVPADILARAEPAQEAHRHRLLSRYRSIGLSRPQAGHDIMIGTEAEARVKQTRAMVESGELVSVRVEGHKPLLYAPAEEGKAIASAAAQLTGDPGAALVAPLDPILWDRSLVRDVFDFNYLWEVYTPEHKRRFGYYVLPILFGDRLVGRLEPRFDRTSRSLRILGVWWEKGFSPRQAEGFVDALRQALREYADFVGARSVEWLPATGGAGRLFGSIIGRRTARRA